MLIAEHCWYGEVKPVTSQTCLPQRARSRWGHGLINTSNVPWIGNQRHVRENVCLSKKKTNLEWSKLSQNSPELIMVCYKHHTVFKEKHTLLKILPNVPSLNTQCLEARPESQEQTEVRAIQFLPLVTLVLQSSLINQQLKGPSAPVVTPPQLLLSLLHLGSDALN